MRVFKLPPDDLYDLDEFFSALFKEFSEDELRDQCASIMSFSLAMCDCLSALDKLTHSQAVFDDAIMRTICINFFRLCHVNRRLVKMMYRLYPKYRNIFDGASVDPH